MRFSDRTYTIGDRVFVLAQFSTDAANNSGGDWEITEDLPLYHSSQYSYALVEAVVNAISLPFVPFGREANEAHSYMNALQVLYMRGVGGRLLGMTYNTDAVTLSDINVMLNNNEPAGEKREFLKQFIMPLVVSTAQYNKLLTDIATAAGRDPASVVSADKEAIVRRAEELGIPIRLIDSNSPAFTSVMNPANTQILRTWDDTGLPSGTSTATSAPEPDYEEDEDEEEGID